MSIVPPLPPRRKVPPRQSLNQTTSPDDEDSPVSEKPLSGIAARIAALNLNQVGLPPGKASDTRPQIPRRTSQAPNSDSTSRDDQYSASNQNLPKKAPPPMPVRKSFGPSATQPKSPEPQDATTPPKRPPPLPHRRTTVQEKQSSFRNDSMQDSSSRKPSDETAGPTTTPKETPPPLPARRAVPPPLPSRKQSHISEPQVEQESEDEGASETMPSALPQEGQEQSAPRTLPPEPSKRRLPPMPPPPGRKVSVTEIATQLKEESASVEPISKPPPINRANRPPPVSRSTRPIPSARPMRAPTPEPEPAYEPEPQPEQHTTYDPDAETCLKCRNFDAPDHHASLFPREGVRTIADLAYDLTSPFDSATDKARVIFTWMHHNIAYDAQSFLTNNLKPTTPEATLRSGMAVCSGYAGLYAAIAELAGVPVLTLNGHAKGYGYSATQGNIAPPFSMNHAWNAVAFDDNEWHLIDSTWGAGYLDSGGVYVKRFTPAYFTMTNDEFGVRHFPEEDQYQLRSDGETMPWESYILAPHPPTELGEFMKMGYDVNAMLPQEKVLSRGQWVTFHLEKVCWHLERKEWWNEYVLFVTPGGNDRVVLDRDERGPGYGWTAKVWIPSESTQVMIYSVSTVGGKEAKGMMPDDVKKAFGRKAMTFAGVAMWKVE